MSRNASPLTTTARNDSIIYYIYAQKPRFIVYILYRVCVCVVYRTGLFNFPPARSPIGYRRSRIVDVRRFGNKKSLGKLRARASVLILWPLLATTRPTLMKKYYIYINTRMLHTAVSLIYIGYRTLLRRHCCSYIQSYASPIRISYIFFLYIWVRFLFFTTPIKWKLIYRIYNMYNSIGIWHDRVATDVTRG